MSALQAVEAAYPNGQRYVELRVHNHCIGNATIVDGGFLVTGKRKPVPTAKEAALQCLNTAIAQHANEMQKLRAMLHTVLKP